MEAEVRQRLRAAVLDDAPADERTAALAAVLQAADLEGLVLNRDERKIAKERFKELASRRGDDPGDLQGDRFRQRGGHRRDHRGHLGLRRLLCGGRELAAAADGPGIYRGLDCPDR